MGGRLDEAFAAASVAMDEHRGNYFYEPIPISLDDTLRQLVQAFAASDDVSRKKVIRQFTPRYRQLFGSFGVRSASVAVRSHRSEPLIEGLLALDLGWPTPDVREQIRDLAPMYHAALKLGIDPVMTFRAAEAIARDDAYADFLENFLSRPEEDKSLEALGYREFSAPDGFRFNPGSSY
jgi:hypothetical protein